MARDLSLAEIAAEVGLSQQHFARAFKVSTGMPPHRYLLQRRLERASQLLMTTPLSLAEISLTCGFSSQAPMTTAFCQAYAATPGKLRSTVRSVPLAA